MTDGAPERLWVPPSERVEQAAITRYLGWLRDERGLRFNRYEDLWRWSVDELEAFWSSIWDFSGVISHSPYERVLDRRVMPGPLVRRRHSELRGAVALARTWAGVGTPHGPRV